MVRFVPPPCPHLARCAHRTLFGQALKPKAADFKLQAWAREAEDTINVLIRPRISEMPVKDWATDADVAYALRRYEREPSWMGLEKAKEGNEAALEKMKVLLEAAAPLYAAIGDDLSWDDVLYLPDLRTLTCVKDLEWPKSLHERLLNRCERAGVKLYTEHAV